MRLPWIPFWSDSVHISLARNAACALQKDGSVRCYDQLDDPVEVEALRGSTLLEAHPMSVTGVKGGQATHVSLVSGEGLKAKPYELSGDRTLERIDALTFGDGACMLAKVKGPVNRLSLLCAGEAIGVMVPTLRNVPLPIDFEPRTIAVARKSGVAVGTDGQLGHFQVEGSNEEMRLKTVGAERDYVAVWANGAYKCTAQSSGAVTCTGSLSGAPTLNMGKVVLPAVDAKP